MHPLCKWCQLGKSQRVGSYRKPDIERPLHFGDKVNCDHLVAHSTESEGLTGDQAAFIIGDLATDWIFGYPVKSKDAEDTYDSLIDFLDENRYLNSCILTIQVKSPRRVSGSESAASPPRPV